MKKLFILIMIAGSIVSCSKEAAIEKTDPSTYIIRVAAIDNNGSKTYTTLSKVKSGKVAIEYETADVSDIKEYDVEVSSDGINFHEVKVIPADLANPNKLYQTTVTLE